jgi:hypothetical protein
MGFKVFTNGSVLPDTDLNDFLMKQTIIVCTSGTRPASPVTGMHVYETDTGKLQKWNGSAWKPVASGRTSVVPTLTASTTNPVLGTGSTAQGWYSYGSEAILYAFFIRFGTSGNTFGSGNYQVSLPQTAATPFGSSIHPAVGTVQLGDNSTGAVSAGDCFVDPASGNFVGLIGSSGTVSPTAPWTWANSDYLSGTIVYPV